MTTNEVVYDYQAPSVEILKVAVEKGFGASGPSEAESNEPAETPWE